MRLGALLRMKIYIAGSLDAQARARELADKLISQGHVITSSWVFGLMDEKDRRQIAALELSQIDQSDALVELSALPGERIRGGKHYEAGYAKGRGKAVYLLGEKEHIFHEFSAQW